MICDRFQIRDYRIGPEFDLQYRVIDVHENMIIDQAMTYEQACDLACEMNAETWRTDAEQ